MRFSKAKFCRRGNYLGNHSEITQTLNILVQYTLILPISGGTWGNWSLEKFYPRGIEGILFIAQIRLRMNLKWIHCMP